VSIAVITDVHANLPALEAALDSIRVDGVPGHSPNREIASRSTFWVTQICTTMVRRFVLFLHCLCGWRSVFR
jgi:hypothetical protein